MQSNPSANKNATAWLWPAVNTLDAAKNTAKQGAIAAAIVAGITALFAILSLFGVELTSIWALVDAGLFALIAFGIYKMSRSCGSAWIVTLFVGTTQPVTCHRKNQFLPRFPVHALFHPCHQRHIRLS